LFEHSQAIGLAFNSELETTVILYKAALTDYIPAFDVPVIFEDDHMTIVDMPESVLVEQLDRLLPPPLRQ
jgi:23S rRNA-/tRNA-specific pseudouridylate synthase